MPWELGFFDGRTGRVFVYPLDRETRNHGTGQEYLDLYPLMDVDKLESWLEQRLPHKEEPAPWGPAGPEQTEDYGAWLGRNWDRFFVDPYFGMQFWGNIVEAWVRLLTGTRDPSR